MTGRRPKPLDDRARENRATYYASNNRMRQLRLKSRRDLKALLNTLVDEYASKLEQQAPTSKEG